jgi:uncharacterized repeat protein (TIGR03803 family)
MEILRTLRRVACAALLCLAAFRAAAQTNFAILHDFTDGNDGASPSGCVLSGSRLYGTTLNGGSTGLGNVFSVKTDGTGFRTLHSFTAGNNGTHPEAHLVLSGTTLYGTTQGFPDTPATVFKINTSGTGFHILHDFPAFQGLDIIWPLALSGSTLYGSLYRSGSFSEGFIFKINTDGTGYETLYEFTGGANDGGGPNELIVSNGVIYGTTDHGGEFSSGTLFSLHTDGTQFTPLVYFDGGAGGAGAQGPLALTANTLYGTTTRGGAFGGGAVFRIGRTGRGFRVIHSFSFRDQDGTGPESGVTITAADGFGGGTLYGTTSATAGIRGGTVFKLSGDGTGFSVLHAFTGGTDGSFPLGSLVFSNGKLYGTTFEGGGTDSGVVFSLR